ncbi:MAG: glycosyltransferase N-terminal domain-containing protein [Bacteroidota bacterium]
MPGHKRIWFHCASLGEFEQGRPLIEACRVKYPDYEILLTFFSPSGYEVRKNYDGVDFIFYLPMDTPQQAKRFVEIVQPTVVFFIKYEYWYNMLNVLDKKHIPVFIVSAIFRPTQHFFSFYGSWFRAHLSKITHFFVQNEESLAILASIGIKQTSLTGDTRFDRVFTIAQQAKEFPLIKEFRGDDSLFLLGSSWPEDEKIVSELIAKNLPGLKFVIAPHEVTESRIQTLLEKMPEGTLRYTKLEKGSKSESPKVLIVDSMGILSSLYQYASFAYIGGGFGKGIHNVLEAATFGMPVFFGPNYLRFQEACDLVERGGAFPLSDSRTLIGKVQELQGNPVHHDKISSITKSYVSEKRGATAQILSKINSYL